MMKFNLEVWMQVFLILNVVNLMNPTISINIVCATEKTSENLFASLENDDFPWNTHDAGERLVVEGDKIVHYKPSKYYEEDEDSDLVLMYTDSEDSDSNEPQDFINSDSNEPRQDFNNSNSNETRQDFNNSDSNEPRRDFNISDSNEPRRDFNNSDSNEQRRDFNNSDSNEPRRDFNNSDSNETREDRDDCDSGESTFTQFYYTSLQEYKVWLTLIVFLVMAYKYKTGQRVIEKKIRILRKNRRVYNRFFRRFN